MRRVFFSLLFLLLFITVPGYLARASANPPGTETNESAQLTQVRWSTYTDAVTGVTGLRLVFDISGPVQVDGTITNTSPTQLMLTIRGASPGKLDAIKLDGKVADQVTVSAVDGQNSKLTIGLLTMVNAGDYKIFTLPKDDKANKPFRVVVDINKSIPKTRTNFMPGLKGKIIVIDPGHGGSDTGAIGPDNIQEKTVNLAVALKVKALLEEAGAKVVMTRTDDRDVYAPNASASEELGARAEIGNKSKADVFVDIHANSFGNPQISGTGTYYYQKSIYDKLLAQSIQNDVVSAAGLNDRGIYPANFYVLKHTFMPAMLIELGFLSNPDEEKLLNTPQFQQKLAQGIVNGLDNFFIQAAKIGGGN